MNSVTRWNPFREFDDLFANLSAMNGLERRGRSEWMPPVDITETPEHYAIAMDLPAIDIKDINVEVKDGLLTVSGERQETFESNKDDVTRHRVERRYGSFSRGFRLPEDVDGEAISARVKDGVLTLTLAKREENTPRRIEVQPH
ncbi:MAG: HSP20 family small heat-shock protein [Pseudomonadota bacterium]